MLITGISRWFFIYFLWCRFQFQVVGMIVEPSNVYCTKPKVWRVKSKRIKPYNWHTIAWEQSCKAKSRCASEGGFSVDSRCCWSGLGHSWLCTCKDHSIEDAGDDFVMLRDESECCFPRETSLVLWMTLGVLTQKPQQTEHRGRQLPHHGFCFSQLAGQGGQRLPPSLARLWGA